MHRALVATLTPGLKLAKSIYTDRGDVLLARGAVLSARYIQALADRGYRSVFVMDGIADDVEPLGLVSDQLRATAVANVRGVFDLLRHATQTIRDEAAASGAHVLPQVPLQVNAAMEREINQMVSLAEAILNEVMDEEALVGMASLKAHDNYTFEHSVEVAVYGVVLGKRVGLSRAWLKDVALGCLLHDVGKQYVDTRILTKPGKLDDAEFAQIMKHPSLGFQLVRQMPLPNPRPAHIVLQHHERQDGEGYPNRLFGTNQIHRTEAERFNPRRISLMAEIAAIADVYSALASDRPYRAAYSPDRVFELMRQESGQHLNSELMRAFVTYVQHFPIGSYVRISGGTYDGALGVVTNVSANAPARPFVRLLFDRTGRPFTEGAEIDLRRQPSSVELQVVPDTYQPLDAYAGSSHPPAPSLS